MEAVVDIAASLTAVKREIAEKHGTRVIAEGVERREEFETVRDLGVHLAQGFLFYRPKYFGRPNR